MNHPNGLELQLLASCSAGLSFAAEFLWVQVKGDLDHPLLVEWELEWCVVQVWLSNMTHGRLDVCQSQVVTPACTLLFQSYTVKWLTKLLAQPGLQLRGLLPCIMQPMQFSTTSVPCLLLCLITDSGVSPLCSFAINDNISNSLPLWHWWQHLHQ